MKCLNGNFDGPLFTRSHLLLKNLLKMFLHFSISLFWWKQLKKRHQKQLKRMSILSFQKVLSCEKSSSFFPCSYKSNPLPFRPHIFKTNLRLCCVRVCFPCDSVCIHFREKSHSINSRRKNCGNEKGEKISFLTFSFSYFFLLTSNMETSFISILPLSHLSGR